MQQKALRSIVELFPEGELKELEAFRQKHIQDVGREIPFHVNLLYDFLLPGEIVGETIEKLQRIGEETPEFSFWARPISSFPTTKVLYLSPTPLTPIESLREELLASFPPGNERAEGSPGLSYDPGPGIFPPGRRGNHPGIFS